MMRWKYAAAGVIGIGLLAGIQAHRMAAPAVESIDFGARITPTVPAYRAEAPAPTPAREKDFRIPITHDTITIADGVRYAGWTFGGTVPGPVLRVRQGDQVKVTLVNESPMAHSIDFHAARIPPDKAYRTIMPGQEVSFEFTARTPGVFLVHCGTPPVLMHIMQGMYLAIIVDPAGGWPDRADKEFVLVQSEFYPDSTGPGLLGPDFHAALENRASYVVFNGRAFQYRNHPLEVAEGDRVRFFVVNAGPNRNSDFHIVGAIFDKVYPDGDVRHALGGVQTYTVPAGGGVVFETAFARNGSGAGTYPFVTHSFADAEKGAVGLIRVTAPRQVATARLSGGE
ncbi:MAG: multicopper oxidase domain-containing protein [Gemmatimonadales bacterium]